jgi:hypothetical protein
MVGEIHNQGVSPVGQAISYHYPCIMAAFVGKLIAGVHMRSQSMGTCVMCTFAKTKWIWCHPLCLLTKIHVPNQAVHWQWNIRTYDNASPAGLKNARWETPSECIHSEDTYVADAMGTRWHFDCLLVNQVNMASLGEIMGVCGWNHWLHLGMWTQWM